MTSGPVPAPAAAPRWQRWLLQSALSRVALFAGFAWILFLLTSVLVGWLGWLPKDTPEAQRVAGLMMRQIVPTLGAYLLLARLVERRRPSELALRWLVPGTLAGFAGGALLLASVIGVLWLAGCYEITGRGTGAGWATGLFVAGLGTAIAEEIVFRGMLYRLVAQAHGDRWALGVSALLFGGLHLGNPNATLWTSFAIAVEAGVLLGVVYAVTRSLWPCIGLHMAWNFMEGSVFASPVSGRLVPGSLLEARFSGPDWLTGGAFGVEGSVVTIALCLAASAALLAHRRRRTHNHSLAAGASAC